MKERIDRENMLELTSTQLALFAILRDEPLSDLFDPAIDWEALFTEAENQSVALMLKSNQHVPQKIMDTWSMRFLPHIAANMHSFYAASEMNRIMRETKHPYVILKGLSSASYYPNYFKRALGDVDFLIDQDERAAVEKALEQEGYRNCETSFAWHVAFCKDQQDLEMHFDIPGVPYGELGEKVHEYLKSIIGDAEEQEINGTMFRLACPKHHGLVLLLHMQYHMLTEGIGLRHLMDWCYFVDRTETEDFWNTDLLPILRKIGLMQFAATMTRVGAIYLHTAMPHWCQDSDEKLCDDVMADILNGGNFGRKDETRSASQMMITDHGRTGAKYGKLHNLWNMLIHTIELRWPKTKKYPILYVIYIPYLVIRRACRVLSGSRTPLWKGVRDADERKSVYERLHIFET